MPTSSQHCFPGWSQQYVARVVDEGPPQHYLRQAEGLDQSPDAHAQVTAEFSGLSEREFTPVQGGSDYLARDFNDGSVPYIEDKWRAAFGSLDLRCTCPLHKRSCTRVAIKASFQPAFALPAARHEWQMPNLSAYAMRAANY